ncbi:hypothetical protein RUM43_005247 [Polyplax serrata]|uniref:HTH OST-type domain-containing protein n=1 Tax=Polyplax serrata TaxID=468196 RepID=A0AAN8XRF1_POLSC
MNEAETILVIRSLLSSCKSSMNVLVLNNEFRSETGIDIPLFGHKNFIDFLKSIPETVKLTGNYPNQQVSLISSSKSAHIVALVKKQRSKCNAKEINGRLRRTKCDTACDCRTVQIQRQVATEEYTIQSL